MSIYFVPDICYAKKPNIIHNKLGKLISHLYYTSEEIEMKIENLNKVM